MFLLYKRIHKIDEQLINNAFFSNSNMYHISAFPRAQPFIEKAKITSDKELWMTENRSLSYFLFLTLVLPVTVSSSSVFHLHAVTFYYIATLYVPIISATQNYWEIPHLERYVFFLLNLFRFPTIYHTSPSVIYPYIHFTLKQMIKWMFYVCNNNFTFKDCQHCIVHFASQI